MNYLGRNVRWDREADVVRDSDIFALAVNDHAFKTDKLPLRVFTPEV